MRLDSDNYLECVPYSHFMCVETIVSGWILVSTIGNSGYPSLEDMLKEFEVFEKSS